MDSSVSHGKFILINNVLKQYDQMKVEIKEGIKRQFIQDFSLFIKRCYLIV